MITLHQLFTGSYVNVPLGCNPATPSGSLGTATATDACGAVTITSSDGSVVSNVCNRSLTRTFTARDACNNTATTSRTVTWTADLTPPTFTGSYTTVSLGCNPSNPSGSLGMQLQLMFAEQQLLPLPMAQQLVQDVIRSITRTFTVVDGCSNSATISRTVSWTDDNIPPAFTGSYSTISLGCNPVSPSVLLEQLRQLMFVELQLLPLLMDLLLVVDATDQLRERLLQKMLVTIQQLSHELYHGLLMLLPQHLLEAIQLFH
jgi:hypothetical protein